MTLNKKALNLHAMCAHVHERWSPLVIAELNDYQFKIARLQGEFVWHEHPETDEAFLVIAGTLVIDFRDGAVSLGPGELFVVPSQTEHRPRADADCFVLLIEPRGVINTGESGGPLTAPQDAWLNMP